MRYNKEQRESRSRALACIRDEVLPLSAEFQTWVEDQFDHILYYRKNAYHDYTGYCDCGAVVHLDRASAGKYTTCPSCGKTVRMRDANRCRWYEAREIIAYVHKTSEGWMQRIFVVYRYSRFAESVTTKYHYDEDQRDHLHLNGYFWSFYPRGYLDIWTPGIGRIHGQGWSGWRAESMPMKTFPDNLEILFGDSEFRYSQLKTAAAKSQVNPFQYLAFYVQHPKIEMLYKSGLYRLAEQWQDINVGWIKSYKSEISAIKTLKELGIENKSDLKECAKGNYGYDELKARMRIRNWNLAPNEVAAAMSFMKELNDRSGEDFEYSFITNERFFRYYLEQSGDFKSERNFLSDYSDYVGACIQLNLNLEDTAIKIPKSLKTAHDWTNDLIKVQENQIYEIPIRTVYDNLRRLCEWTDGELQIIMPRSCAEIVREGREQNHCVGRYCGRVAKGESVILFIRRVSDPEKSFYTMEIRLDMERINIVQCRGYGNQDRSPEDGELVEKFLKKYSRWFNHRPAQGYDPEKIIAKYYKAVICKPDGRYFSHYDLKTEYRIGEEAVAETDRNPDATAVKGLHIASLEFAQAYGDRWPDVAILEVEVNLNDVIVPDAHDQIRTSRFKVLREVPMSEMGEWGLRHMKKIQVKKIAS